MAKIEIESEVSGNVWKIEKQVGDALNEDDVIMILESMKMEIPIEAPETGTLIEIKVNADDQVEEDQIVAVIETS
jgi:acetyl-CoA carboxylase biotin carboxyl carrier protein